MLYMVVERFSNPGALDIYRRLRDRGRTMPDGLTYVSSWVDLDFSKCFQLMETEDSSLFELWTRAWADLIDFEIIPVRTSAEAVQVIAPKL
jgi:Domain of unknown function (DUF3303)